MRTSGSVISPLLVGRDDLLALGERRIGEAGRGRGGLLFLAGEAGIGKTRLLGAIERRATASGFAVARGVAFPRDVEVAGGVLLDLARSLGRAPGLREAGRALGERLETSNIDGGAGGDPHRRRRILVLDAVDLLAGLAARGRVMVSLEDLHCADELTLEILAALARRVPDLRLAIVATYRSDELYPRIPMREWHAPAGRPACRSTWRSCSPLLARPAPATSSRSRCPRLSRRRSCGARSACRGAPAASRGDRRLGGRARHARGARRHRGAPASIGRSRPRGRDQAR
jgi:AAA ATPase domain